MAYCLPADVVVYAAQASAHTAQVTILIAEAQVTVDSVLRQVYAVPFADGSVNPLVKQLTAQLAAGRWYQVSGAQVGNVDQVEHGRRLEASVMGELRDIVANPTRLNVEQLGGSLAHGGVKTGGGTPVFDMGEPTGWGAS